MAFIALPLEKTFYLYINHFTQKMRLVIFELKAIHLFRGLSFQYAVENKIIKKFKPSSKKSLKYMFIMADGSF